MKEIKIIIFVQISSSAAVSTDDGGLLFERIVKVLENDARVILDFHNIELITSTFLNAAIGQLYSKYDSPLLRKHLKVKNLANEDLNLLKKVVDRAKDYFKDKERMEKNISKVLGDE